jgi:hypothetical protein
MDDTYSLDTIRIEIYPGAHHGTLGMQPARGHFYARRERARSTWKPSSSCMAVEACETARPGCSMSTVILHGQEAVGVVLLTYRCMGARQAGELLFDWYSRHGQLRRMYCPLATNDLSERFWWRILDSERRCAL